MANAISLTSYTNLQSMPFDGSQFMNESFGNMTAQGNGDVLCGYGSPVNGDYNPPLSVGEEASATLSIMLAGPTEISPPNTMKTWLASWDSNLASSTSDGWSSVTAVSDVGDAAFDQYTSGNPSDPDVNTEAWLTFIKGQYLVWLDAGGMSTYSHAGGGTIASLLITRGGAIASHLSESTYVAPFSTPTPTPTAAPHGTATALPATDACAFTQAQSDGNTLTIVVVGPSATVNQDLCQGEVAANGGKTVKPPTGDPVCTTGGDGYTYEVYGNLADADAFCGENS